MKKWKDIPANEKWMMAFIVLLLIGILLRWTAVKDGVFRGFNWFRSDDTEQAAPAESLEIVLPDAAPDEQPEVIILETEE